MRNILFFVDFGCSCGLFCAYLSLMMPSTSKIIGIEICELRTIHFRRFMKIVECLPFKHSKLELLYGDGLKYGGNDLVIKQAHVIFVNDIKVPASVVAKLIYGGILEPGTKVITLNFEPSKRDPHLVKSISVPKAVAVEFWHSSAIVPFVSVKIFQM